MDQTPEQIIASALALPADQRAVIISALENSLSAELLKPSENELMTSVEMLQAGDAEIEAGGGRDFNEAMTDIARKQGFTSPG